jgi:hypothetical protein
MRFTLENAARETQLAGEIAVPGAPTKVLDRDGKKWRSPPVVFPE